MSAGDNKSDGAGPRAGLRSLQILMVLAAKGSGMSIGQLSTQLDVPRASLHRLLRSLDGNGFLDMVDGVYSLGAKSFILARLIDSVIETREFPACARPVLEQLSRDTDETVILGVLSDTGTEIVYADVIVADSPLRYAVPAGDRRPLYSSASGRAVLAFQPDQTIEEYIDSVDFIPLTPSTVGKAEIQAVLENIRAEGVSIDDGGHYRGASATASPVFDSTGKAFGAIVVAGPTNRIRSSGVDVKQLIHEAGETISRILGYTGSYPGAVKTDPENA